MNAMKWKQSSKKKERTFGWVIRERLPVCSSFWTGRQSSSGVLAHEIHRDCLRLYRKKKKQEKRTLKSRLLYNKCIHIQVEIVCFPPLFQGSELISMDNTISLKTTSIKNELYLWRHRFCIWVKTPCTRSSVWVGNNTKGCKVAIFL